MFGKNVASLNEMIQFQRVNCFCWPTTNVTSIRDHLNRLGMARVNHGI